jgi:hypothetical protein
LADAAKAVAAFHNTTVPAGGTLAHLQVGADSFRVAANGALKLWRFDETRLVQPTAAAPDGRFCLSLDQVRQP